MKSPLTHTTIAIAGTFPDPRSLPNLQRWIHLNGGTNTSSVDPQVTHLICSPEEWAARTSRVKHAIALKRIKIVTYDWLEDSLLAGRRKREKTYLWEEIEKERRREARRARKLEKDRKRGEKEAIRKFEQGCLTALEEIHQGGIHIYHDLTMFAHDITLFRADVSENRNEFLYLRLYESHAIPHLYSTTATYSRHVLQTPTDLTCPPKHSPTDVLAMHDFFEKAKGEWRKFFLAKTGCSWEERLNPPEIKDQGKFRYIAPLDGQPQGMVPMTWEKWRSAEKAIAEREGHEGVVEFEE